MGSVIANEKCPHCGNEDAYSEYWYKTDEVVIMCNQCGYMYECFIARKEDGSIATIDPNKPFKFDNIIYNKSELPDPFGCVHIKGEGGNGQYICIGNEEEFNIIKKELLNTSNPKIKMVTLKRFINNEFTEEVIYNADGEGKA